MRRSHEDDDDERLLHVARVEEFVERLVLWNADLADRRFA